MTTKRCGDCTLTPDPGCWDCFPDKKANCQFDAALRALARFGTPYQEVLNVLRVLGNYVHDVNHGHATAPRKATLQETIRKLP